MVSDQPEIKVNLRVSGDFAGGIPISDNFGKQLENALGVIFSSLKSAAGFSRIELSVSLTDDREIRAVNLKHRGIDDPTDVLSFPMLEEKNVPGDENDGPPVSLGDILISMETVARQANDRGISSLERFCECFVHGILHLLGWEHETDGDREGMENEEDRLVPEVVEIFKQP